MNRKLSKLAPRILVLTCLLTTSVYSDIIWNEPGVAGGITDLTIGTRTYDVEFRYGSFTEFWGDPAAPNPEPVCWDDSAITTAAVIAAIQEEFLASDPVPLNVCKGFEPEYKLPYAYANGHIYYDAARATDWGFTNSGLASSDQWVVYAVFTEVAPVPLPGAVLLGSLGLVSSGLYLRRRIA
ncbi:MAG: hypothetical protein ABFE13_06140 [Phycisphaerales bacterium]